MFYIAVRRGRRTLRGINRFTRFWGLKDVSVFTRLILKTTFVGTGVLDGPKTNNYRA